MLSSPTTMTVVMIRKEPFGVGTYHNCTKIECKVVNSEYTYVLTDTDESHQEQTHNFRKKDYNMMVI